MFRRCLTCLIQDLFKFANRSAKDVDEVVHLDRVTAQELTLCAVLSLVAQTDVTAPYDEEVYATDASLAKGAYTVKHVGLSASRLLWLCGDKKGSYTSLDLPARAQLRAVGCDLDQDPVPDWIQKPSRAPDLKFDAVEICGGSGVLTSAMSFRGLVCCVPIDLSRSPQFDVCDVRLLEWVLHMLSEQRLHAVICEPPCTTFSVAQHPSSRSYQCPLGFNRKDAKTLLGNTLAFRCLTMLWFAHRLGAIGLLEQPRLSKMAWLSVWKFLRIQGLTEAIVASCNFNSPHKKEFKFLLAGIDETALELKCPGGHKHLKVEGKYTKASAVYTPELSAHLAEHIFQAVQRRKRSLEDERPTSGLESVVINDLLSQDGWTTGGVWEWQQPGHINVLESRSYVGLLRALLLKGGDRRFTALLDSRVAKGCHAKGRSSSWTLRPSLFRACSYQIAGNLHGSLGFAPTRLNTADCPTRDKPMPLGSSHSIFSHLAPDQLAHLHSLQFSRPVSGWIRFYILVTFVLCPVEASGFPPVSDYWIFSSCISALGLVILCSAVVCVCLSIGLLVLSIPCRSVARGFLLLGIASSLCNNLSNSRIIGVSPAAIFIANCVCCHGMPLNPSGRDEVLRAQRRSGNQLQADRVVLQQTRDRRGSLLSAFDEWLGENLRVTLEDLLGRQCDPEQVAEALVSYGKDMYNAGKSYGKFSETINAVTAKRPGLRRQVGIAWDLAFNWVVDEPHDHHAAMPLSIMLSMTSLALLWGWTQVAGVIALGWAGVLRIGEIFNAVRSDLVLPEDSAPGIQTALLKIRLPKTRGRAARHQAVKIDPSDIVALLSAVFGKLSPSSRLWPWSPATLRKRFRDLQIAIGLESQLKRGVLPFSLASLRPGGATYWLGVTEDAEYVRRKGRWVSAKVLEIYLQEATVATFNEKITEVAKNRIALLSQNFSTILARSIFFQQTFIPECCWPKLW